MNARRSALCVASLIAAAGATFVLSLHARSDSEARARVEPVAAAASVARERPLPDASPEPLPRTAGSGIPAVGMEPECATEVAASDPATGTLAMPIAEKLAADHLTAVPHELIGAWDDAPGSDRRGDHRTIVAVVESSLPTRDLEQLVWDIRNFHDGAEVLDVRVYDSAEATVRSAALDGGADRERHLVADVKRNDRLGFDQITVRGRTVGP